MVVLKKKNSNTKTFVIYEKIKKIFVLLKVYRYKSFFKETKTISVKNMHLPRKTKKFSQFQSIYRINIFLVADELFFFILFLNI